MYITEADDGKLKHLQHLEDLHIDNGKEGLKTAISSLKTARQHAESGDVSSKITQKVDGSPALVTGHNPENGKFFVASKSAFNKNPKLNYTPEDIEQNHGHAPGLVHKLKAALEHLPKIMPKHGVFQGDMLHSGDDLEHSDKGTSFKPNTIKYTAHGEEGKKVAKSKVGIAFHTKYTGADDLQGMHAEPMSQEDHTAFGHHKDVYNLPVAFHGTGKKLSAADSRKFNGHLAKAAELGEKIDHSKVTPHSAVLNTYINSTIRNGTTPSYSGFVSHVGEKALKDVASVKMQASKEKKEAGHKAVLEDIHANREHITNALAVHHHIQSAKNVLINHMDTHHVGLEHEIAGKKAAPEGYVINHDGTSSKLVNRRVFSAANFANKG